MPASTRITSRSAKAQAPLRGALPHPQLDRGLTQCLGQLGDLGLELLLACRGPGLPGDQSGLADFKELTLPVPDRLLRHLRRRAASATVVSPARIDNTIRIFASAGNTGGLAMTIRLLSDQGPQETGSARNLDARHGLRLNSGGAAHVGNAVEELDRIEMAG
jgi:hypothetical protein